MAEVRAVTVMIWSDVICPFCNVARDRARRLADEPGVRVQWLPFDLHPEYPPEGIPRADLLRRYGDRFLEVVRTMHAEIDLPYSPHPDRVPNSRPALELGEWARERGAHDRLHDRVMDAYWSEGRDISDWEVLEACVAAVGLDADEARGEVVAGAFRAAVDASTRTAQQAGITGVPAFVFDGRLLVSGAQPPEILSAALERVRADGGGEGG